MYFCVTFNFKVGLRTGVLPKNDSFLGFWAPEMPKAEKRWNHQNLSKNFMILKSLQSLLEQLEDKKSRMQGVL